TVEPSVSAVTGSGRRDVRLAVRYDGDQPVAASVRVRVALAAAEPPWWLVPGLFYGENRPAGSARVFPRFAIGGDLARMESDRWEFRADRAATPSVFAWTASAGVAVCTDESSALGITGLGFGYDAGAGRAELHLRFPYAEAPLTYYGSAEARAPLSESYTWTPGEAVELAFAVYDLPAERHSYARVLREEHARLAPGASLNPWVDVPTAADLAAEGLRRWHYAEPGVLLETVGFDREVTGQDGRPVDRQAMHVGWVSGTPWAYALLAHGRRVGSADDVATATRVLDFICSELSPSGTFWGVWYRGRGWTSSWSPVPHSLHSRTLGEATLFVLRALALEPGHETWVHAARSNLDAVVARQRADGNPGSAHHALTGEVLSWDGCAGLAWVNALAEAGALDTDGRYLAAAERAGDYYAPFVRTDFLNGAPEDVDLAPTSEDGYVAVMAYLALHRRTGDQRWLDLARRAADWMLTFRYSYNVSFPAGTLLDVYRFASRGADNASPSNQHLHAYGLICTAELAELSAATGDPHYVERARESLACFRQFIARFDGDFNAYRGMASERYYQTECFQPKGMLLTLSHAWSVGVLLLACEQALLDPMLREPPR
ncbi:MAG TPA: hypothetical protein VHC23_08615, partial [Jatrophihabitans sp.]|nr:hypothetical protein [Jatrophihabitans sp.]